MSLFDLDRRQLIRLAMGVTAQLSLTGALRAAPVETDKTPERSIQDYRRMLCGQEGEDILWWYIGDLYLNTPGESVIPIARPMTASVFRAEGGDGRSFRYNSREAGMILDLKTGAPLSASPITGKPIDPPKIFDAPHVVEWKVLDDGNIAKQNRDAHTTLHLNWTRTPSNTLLLETEPGPNAFGLVSGAAEADWTEQQSTRTIYAKPADIAGGDFVPAQMFYNIAIKATPPWLGFDDKRDRWLIVRGLGTKARKGDIVNPDLHALLKQYFPSFL